MASQVNFLVHTDGSAAFYMAAFYIAKERYSR